MKTMNKYELQRGEECTFHFDLLMNKYARDSIQIEVLFSENLCENQMSTTLKSIEPYSFKFRW